MPTTKPAKRVALYLRVSTSEQTTENQRRELATVAERSGWHVVAEYEDAGISGAKGRDKRPGLDALLKAVVRREVDLVAAWSVDRLGRSLQDLVSLLSDLHEKRCDLYLHVQGIDTTTAAGKAMFQMMGVFAEFERAMIRERVNAGLARARDSGSRSGKAIGRPKASAVKEAAVLKLRREKPAMGIIKIAKAAGVGVSVVQRVLKGKNETTM